MDKMRDPLLEQLSEPPLKKQGFTDQLRLKIEHEIMRWERKEREKNKKRIWIPLWTGAALLLSAVIYFGLPEPAQEQRLAVNQEAAAPILEVEERIAYEFQSGLLLGTRYASDEEGLGSEYRTLWIAPEGGAIEVKREGTGLLVPYRMDFWRLDDLDSEKGEQVVASQLTKSAIVLTADSPQVISAERLSERISFAGQEFVAIERVSASGNAGWITTLSSIAGQELLPVPLQDIVDTPELIQHELTELFVMREQGRWGIQAGSNAGIELYRLNRKAAVSDHLCVSWSEIEQLASEAIDAVCSPTADWIAILVPDAIHIYPVKQRIVSDLLLSIPLRTDERIVMAEWATGDYVEKWTEWTNRLLQ